MHGELQSTASAGSLGDPLQIILDGSLTEVHHLSNLFVAMAT